MHGKTALITGGAKRVGAASARLLHEAGANLMIHYRSSATEARALQDELNAIRPDSVALIQADLLPALGNRIWDTSALLSESSLVGQTLHALVGYDPRPAGMQLLFYAVTASLIAIGMKLWGRPATAAPAR